MARSLTFFLPLSLKILEEILTAFQSQFEDYLNDTFSDEELDWLEPEISSMGAVSISARPQELTFDDLEFFPEREEEQRRFFDSCLSLLVMENLPYLESNRAQVTYIRELVKMLPDFLAQLGFEALLGRNELEARLLKLKGLEGFAPEAPVAKPKQKAKFVPVDPIDFLVADVYRELERLKDTEVDLSLLPSGLQKVFLLMRKESLDPAQLYVRSGLNAKDFDDGLEKLKFFLRSLPPLQ